MTHLYMYIHCSSSKLYLIAQLLKATTVVPILVTALLVCVCLATCTVHVHVQCVCVCVRGV